MDNKIDIDGIHEMINADDLASDVELEELETQIITGHDFAKKLDNDAEITHQFSMLMENDGVSIREETVSPALSIASNSTRATMKSAAIEKNFSKPYIYNETIEEKRSRALNSFIDSHTDETTKVAYDLSNDRKDDEKLVMVEQIEELKNNLELEGVDVSRFEVSEDDDFEKIKGIHTKLKLKSQYKSYSCMFEHGVILGAECVEWAFDGNKEYFGYAPDMTGWSDTVQVRLQRMRLETASFVSTVMQEYKFSSGLNILAQLLLSGIMHSVTKNKEKQDAMLTANGNDSMNTEYKNALKNII